MKAPGTAYDDPLVGKDPQPAHMDDYVETIRDNGGVHINSGIPNRAFYLAATEIGGYAWEVTDGSGTRRCATPRCAPTPASPPSLALTVIAAERLQVRAARSQRRSRTPGTMWAT